MLDEGVRICYDGLKIEARTEFADEKCGEIHTFLKPVDNQEERCYFIENEEPLVKVYNEKIQKVLIVEYSKETLPAMVLWQSNATNDYALGIEPTTTFLDNKFEYTKIKRKEKKKYKIQIRIKTII